MDIIQAVRAAKSNSVEFLAEPVGWRHTRKRVVNVFLDGQPADVRAIVDGWRSGDLVLVSDPSAHKFWFAVSRDQSL